LARTYAGLGRLLPVLEIVRDTMPEISEVTTLDPEQICPPVALPVLQRERIQPAPAFTTNDRLSAGTSFGFDSATLTPEGRETLRVLAARLVAADSTYSAVLVEGHTCSLGPAEYNQDLSERRARSVADHLVSLGVRPEVIQFAGYGEERPIADNATREGRERNRRVEVSTDLRKRDG